MKRDADPSPVYRVATNYLAAFEHMMGRFDVALIEDVVDCLRTARELGATLYIAGNGGSASTASHLVNDLGKATKSPNAAPIRVMSLNDNVSWLTALGNDEGYNRVFSGQLENFARPGDVLIVISASGNSPNLIEAVDFARQHGVRTIGMLGFDGGVLREKVDLAVWVPSEKGQYGLVESAHSLLCHMITECLVKDLQFATDRGQAQSAVV